MKKPADPTKTKVIIIPHPPKNQQDGAPDPNPAADQTAPEQTPPAPPQTNVEAAEGEKK